VGIFWNPHCCIRKKHFCPGGMGTSEWTRTVGAVRDTQVVDYSTPSINATHCIAYRPPIPISPFLLTLSVSYSKQTLSHCGQLWPYVGMGLVGTHWHWDCIAIGDAANISPHVPSTLSSRSVAVDGGKIWSYPAVMIHANAWIHQISDRASETKSWER
jgi:hypothetical protein